MHGHGRRATPALPLALLLVLSAAACAYGQTVVNVSVDCSTPVGPMFTWRSCGYSPAESALRADGIENTLRVGSVPRRGVSQVRIHFLLDLLVVTGFTPSPPSLTYDWSLLDFAVDTLVENRLSPGFELMGSPAGFPTLPLSFFSTWHNNFAVDPNATLALFRTMVRDIAVHYAGRYGADEVKRWNFETWNEPECGWGWPAFSNSTVFSAYKLHYDAGAAGIEDAEAALGTKLIFGGPGSCSSPERSDVLSWLFVHAENGTNAWTGSPGRLDFLSIHYKGQSTSYMVAQQALTGFTWMRGPGGVGPKLRATPFYNDEADPMVGWLDPESWRADGRYGAIIPKVINQHLLQIADNGTVTLNNPMGLLSNDNGFMNLDGYNGFEMRTMAARFTDNTTGAYAFVRKQSIAVMALLSKLGTTRVGYSGQGAPGPDEVATSPTGVVATVSSAGGASGVDPLSVSVLVYNSNDTVGESSPGSGTASVSLALANHPFTPGQQVVLVQWRLDNNHTNPWAVWLAQGSPNLPTTDQLLALWAADGLGPLAAPVRLTVPPAGQPFALPSFTLPMPGVALVHVAAQPPGGSPPPAPANLRAFVKSPALSLVDSARYAEVLVHWDCDAPVNASSGAPSSITLGYTVQLSTAGLNGPWSTAQDATAGDPTCSFLHPAPPQPSPPAAPQLFYRVAAVDYWGTQGGWSDPVQAGPWPAIA
jgi:L-iduronidase